jgi:hypothetical protein
MSGPRFQNHSEPEPVTVLSPIGENHTQNRNHRRVEPLKARTETMATDTKDRTHAATPARDRRFARQELDHQLLIRALPYEINNRLRYSDDPNLRLNEHSTRRDVREVRHLLLSIRGIGPKSMAVIDAWLENNEP